MTIQNGLVKLKWGFVFIMLGFRIQGIDIFPDIIGYILFAVGLSSLAPYGDKFSKAARLNIPMVFLSLFTIYQAPAQGESIQFGPLGGFGVIVSIVSFIFNLLMVYNLFMGIRELEEGRGEAELAGESERRWNHYLMLQIAAFFSIIAIFIPIIGVAYVIIELIAAICVLIGITGFIGRCVDSMNQGPC